MADFQLTTVAVPMPGQRSRFEFKEPFKTYYEKSQNINSSIRFEVVSVISMTDMIKTDHIDPFTTIYVPVGLSEDIYKFDINNNVKIISLKYTTPNGVEKHIRIPANYIASYTDVTDIDYSNKFLVLDMGYLREDLDLSVWFSDIVDFVRDRTGVTPTIKEVAVGEVYTVSSEEDELRETLRTTNITVNKTLYTQLEELQLKYDSLLQKYKNLVATLP